MKSYKVEADRLGGIIPITDHRAAIQWKDGSGNCLKFLLTLFGFNHVHNFLKLLLLKLAFMVLLKKKFIVG